MMSILDEKNYEAERGVGATLKLEKPEIRKMRDLEILNFLLSSFFVSVCVCGGSGNLETRNPEILNFLLPSFL